MVKLGNVAPEGMCEAGRGCRERTVGSLHVKLNCSLEKSRSGLLYKAMEGEAAGSCRWGSGSDGARPFLGELGLLPGGLSGPGGACNGAEGQGWCVLSSRPLAATEAGGAWDGVMHGKDGSVDMASNPAFALIFFFFF